MSFMLKATPVAGAAESGPSRATESMGASGSTGTPMSSLALQGVSLVDARRAQRWAQLGLVINAVLAIVKLVAGLLGNAYALVADAIESATDMVGSLLVWGGLRIASRDPDERYPFGYGRAEPIATAAVAALMLGAAAGIAIESVRAIRTPHSAPAPFTLAVLALVIVVKVVLATRVLRISSRTGSVVVRADASHHQADAITSGAAFIGITVAILGGPGWEAADDWAALVAAGVISVNGGALFRTALRDLMDRAPDPGLLAQVSDAALETSGVRAIEKLKVRRSGTFLYVDIHVQADAAMSLHDAHILSGRVKGAIRRRVPAALGVLIHMEPYEPDERAGPERPGADHGHGGADGSTTHSTITGDA
jgi:cation diffusion facilitator family transporter